MANDYLSLQRFPGDGVTTDFTVSFAGGAGDTQQGTHPYIDITDVKAYELILASGTEPSERIPRTVEVLGPLTFRVAPAIPVGRVLEISRESEDRYNLVDFRTLQTVSEFDLDLAVRQLLYVTQESSDRSALAEEAANDANSTSDLALLTAEDALQTADGAVSTAETAVDIADGARAQANTATGIANNAVATADSAVSTADAATQAAADASTTANDALSVAQGVEAIALDAQSTADGVASTATNAQNTALAASATADTAYSMAEDALSLVSEAGVASFNGRNGTVVPTYGDYLPSMIPTGTETTLEDSLLGIQNEFSQVSLRVDGVDTDIGGINTAIGGINTSIGGINTALGGLAQFNATIVPLSEAQAGTSTTPRTWTAQRVRQSANAAAAAALDSDSRVANGQTAFGWGNHASAGYVRTTGNQSVAGIKTFSSFPVTPSSAPTTNYQAANKKYVDERALGVGQTWQDVTATRQPNVTYTNTMGRPIFMFIGILQGGSGRGTLVVDGIDMFYHFTGGGEKESLAVIVPAGSTYSYNVTSGSQTIERWIILR